MSFRTSEFPGGHERHCLRRINHADLFAHSLDASEQLLDQSFAENIDKVTAKDASTALAEAIAKDAANADVFSADFEAVLERAVALKPSEETEVVLAVKAELDRLYTVSASLGGEQTKVQEALARLIDLTMQSVQRAAGDDALAVKELRQESAARDLHFKQLECSLLADLLNSNPDDEAFIPTDQLIPTLLSSDKAVLADVVGLFDLQQVSEIISQCEQALFRLTAEKQKNGSISLEETRGSTGIVSVTQNLEFIKGYKVYLEDYG